MKKTDTRPARPARKRSPQAPSPRLGHGDDGPHASRRSTDITFPIVGVGASAGGLEAFTTLLRHLGASSGMALVLIQHLDPTHTSLLRDALAKTTKMSVVQAEDGMRVEPDHVYVIPPNTCLGIRAGLLTLDIRPDDPRVQHLPVDFFFRALAAERGSGAIGVVLSGSASDGTEGLRCIKDAGGITLAQEPKSAKFDGMPQSAVDAGVVDACLPLPELAQELVHLCRHPYVVAAESAAWVHDGATLKEIFVLVQEATGVDFSEYKRPTFERRLARRMALRRVSALPAYVNVLRESPDEVVVLAEDALIHVTSFFRDSEVFESLKANIFPSLVKNRPERTPIRMWVAGCATGEEVYSLGIALVECLGESSRPVQIFGSDVSAKSIDVARTGIYSDGALRDVSEERRKRYFTKVERGYSITKRIRDMCIFVQHDLTRDPPFSKMDLVSCRNVLIYFDQALQKRVVQTFHYALNRPGLLVLGRAESISGFKQLFDVVDKANKIFTRTAVPSTLRFARRSEVQRPESTPRPRETGTAQLDLSRRLDRLLLGRYAPPGVVVNEKMEIIQFRGQTGAYLEPAPGEPQYNLMQMARGGLAMKLRATVAKAKKAMIPVRAAGIEVDHDGFTKTCDVVVIPLTVTSGAEDALYIILFEESPRAGEHSPRMAAGTGRSKRPSPKLEQELAATKEYLQTVIAEHGRANEDLGLANEELVSGNLELQSMNEELETAKEELQSINEELTTVNEELQSRNHEVIQINGDLVNLLTAVDIPILILDAERRIRRFTPKARRILNVVASDIGRALGDIKRNIDVPDLDAQIVDVIKTTTVRESEVQDSDGHWHRLQIRPYKTTDDRIDGAIVSLFDINALKHNVKEAQRANSDSERANHMKDDFLATLSHELRTPLSSMLMRAQLLRRGGMEEAKVRRAGEAIETGVKRQVQLIDDLLDVSRIVTGKLKMEFRPVDVAQVVNAAIEGVTVPVERKALKLDVDIRSGTSTRWVSGDDARLQQIVTNLLANAIKFTPERGTVMVSLAIEAETAILRIKDTGMGIEPDFLSSIFNRFAQDDSASTRAFGGLGLGLAIVRHLVELHHGTVVAESAGSGMGATFTVSLPLIDARRVPSPPDSESALGRAPIDLARLRGVRILIMDDDRATREAIADMLLPTHAEVKLVSSSAEAMTAIDEFRPELLVCDIAMPGEDGYAFIRRLRSLGVAQAGTVPALALTALARAEDRERALAAGYQMHIAKPVDIDRLTAAVLELAASRGAHPVASSRPAAAPTT